MNGALFVLELPSTDAPSIGCDVAQLDHLTPYVRVNSWQYHATWEESSDAALLFWGKRKRL